MSIATELTNLAANRDAIKAAIEAKNPTVAPTNALSSFPAAIASISGGGSSASPVAAMYGWPDIKALLDADTEDYAHKAYVLFDALACPSVPNVVVIGPAQKVITSDGTTYTSAASHTWNTNGLISGRYGWVAIYSGQPFGSLALGVDYLNPQILPLWCVGNTAFNASSEYGSSFSSPYAYPFVALDFPSVTLPSNRGNRMFFACSSLSSIPSSFDTSACTNLSQAFAQCMSLRTVPQGISTSSATNTSLMFYQCYSLVSVPSVLDTSKSTNCSSMFQGCISLPELPDTLDLGLSTNNANAFNGCYVLKKLPAHFSANYSVSFQWSTKVTDKDSVATFANGSITGGFVGNLNACPNSGQTITLNSAIKGLFTASEQSAIEAAMTAKNWTLSW